MSLIQFDNSYARLPERFYSRTSPTPVRAPRLIRLNHELARELGIDVDALDDATAAEIFSGNRIAQGSEPIATAYAGHQFGGWVPQLGDGRAILLGEVVDRAGYRRDIQLKGSGPTPFSRRGDGRAALGPVLREYIVSEAMTALGIPSTRALAAVTTGEKVIREEMLPGAILTRVAASHIRVGTFEYFARRGDVDAVRTLADHVIARHYPDTAQEPRPYRALLDAVVAAQADLIPRWLHVGFIHGVMNTDNMSIAGETIDYGPCAFMDEYDANTVFSSIDHYGRYAYGNQPNIAQWNLARLAECLLPLLNDDQDAAVEDAMDALSAFAPRFEAGYHAGLLRKIGIDSARDGDLELARDLLRAMQENLADFTLTFRGLSDAVQGHAHDEPVRRLFSVGAAYDAWAARWRERLAADGADARALRDAMRRVNPAFIPRNHRVEAAIRAGVTGDFSLFEEMLAVVTRPYDDQPENELYARPPEAHERVRQTFCGT
ncbi:MAG TPA: YdiU family protein [Longimicrobiales bacterium]